MTTLALIRHGNVLNPGGILYGGEGEYDLPLSNTGEKEAKHTGSELKSKGLWPAEIYCSPTQRTDRTSQIIGSFFPGTPITRDSRLGDVLSKSVVGKPASEFIHNPQLVYSYDSPKNMFERISDFVVEIIEEHQGKVVYVVSHLLTIAFTDAWLRDIQIHTHDELRRLEDQIRREDSLGTGVAIIRKIRPDWNLEIPGPRDTISPHPTIRRFPER